MPSLNDIMSIDHVIRVTESGDVEDVTGFYAPELTAPTDKDGQIVDGDRGIIESAKSQGWELLTGWTGQHGYRGPIMHSSEYVGGRLEDHIRETPGIYCVVAVDTDDGESAGWAIAYRDNI